MSVNKKAKFNPQKNPQKKIHVRMTTRHQIKNIFIFISLLITVQLNQRNGTESAGPSLLSTGLTESYGNISHEVTLKHEAEQ